VVFDAIRENVATKVDIAAARVEVEKARIALNKASTWWNAG
jgi:hypothetical protein